MLKTNTEIYVHYEKGISMTGVTETCQPYRPNLNVKNL